MMPTVYSLVQSKSCSLYFELFVLQKGAAYTPVFMVSIIHLKWKTKKERKQLLTKFCLIEIK